MKKIAFLFLPAYSAYAQQQQQTQIQKQHQQHAPQAQQVDADPGYQQQLEQEFAKRARRKNQNAGQKESQAAAKTTVHVRICPTCGDPSDTCSTDQGRLGRGIILTCGCPLCGGTGYS